MLKSQEKNIANDCFKDRKLGQNAHWNIQSLPQELKKSDIACFYI